MKESFEFVKFGLSRTRRPRKFKVFIGYIESRGARILATGVETTGVSA